jgi:Domain of unknown function (DUF4145)
MKCPHCSVSFHAAPDRSLVTYHGGHTPYFVTSYHCPACKKYILAFDSGNYQTIRNQKLIVPSGSSRGPVPVEVPENISADYVEACNILPISPKASAALARRALQTILREQGYKAKDLAKEIEMLLNETDARKAIPNSLRDTVDGVRNFGNFSAHPITDLTSLQIIEVEPHEAEWCLEILEEMFQHFYVRPAETKNRKDALNAKLAAAGKPPAK